MTVTKKCMKIAVGIKRKLISCFHNKVYYRLTRKVEELNNINQNSIKICFILQRTEIFTTVQSLFDTCCADNRFDVSIMILPRYDHGKRCIDINSIEINRLYCDSLKGDFRKIIPYDYGNGDFQELQKNRFDFIFLGLPYQKQYPKKYTFDYLSRIGRLCYIPYGSYYADGKKMIEFGFPPELLSRIDYVFADCDKVYQFSSKKMKLCKNRDQKGVVYNVGYPRFDLVARNENQTGFNSFLWLPRWTTNSADNENSSFIDYKDLFLEFFDKNKELSLTIRPHPAMFENYVANEIMSSNEVLAFKQKIERMDNVLLDDSPSYLESFKKADCVIADYSSIVIEFLLSNKPVIYLGRTENISPEIKSAYYCCDSFETIVESINRLHSRNDEKLKERHGVLEDEKYTKGAAGRIVDVLLKHG